MTTTRTKCPSKGCKNDGVPLCSEHMRPYATEVYEDLARQEVELARVREGKWITIDPEGPLAQEFLRVIREQGGASFERINQLTFQDPAVSRLYLRKLEARNLVKTAPSTRGSFAILAKVKK